MKRSEAGTAPETRAGPPISSWQQGTFDSPGARKALAGFFVSGVLLAFPGAILPSWQYHLSSEYSTIGLYFAGLIAGVVSSAWASPSLLARRGIGWTLSLACGIAAAALVYLAFVPPPMLHWWRLLGLVAIGWSAGLLHTAIFHAISPMYRHNPAATVNLGGILFGLGCLTAALIISTTFYMATPGNVQIGLSFIPVLFGWMYIRSKFDAVPATGLSAAEDIVRTIHGGSTSTGATMPEQAVEMSEGRGGPVRASVSARRMISELRRPGAALLSLLLFFQFGNEWAVAGWLPLFLSQRLGISPATSIGMLALYWFALLVGRVGAQWILPRVRHSRLLLASVAASVFGCTVLLATDNRFGAVAGILMLGAAFAPVYPLVVERIGDRFPHFHPGFYNGIFSFAIAGGLLAPCALGYFASYWGIQVVMTLPLAGSVMVFALLMLIGLEARLGSSAQAAL